MLQNELLCKLSRKMVAEPTEYMKSFRKNLETYIEEKDISFVPEHLLYKIFMGVRIPCEHYMPTLGEGDILFLANDRNPVQNETIVVVNKGYIRIVKWKKENGVVNYYSIHNGKLVATEESLDDVIGYVAYCYHSM